MDPALLKVFLAVLLDFFKPKLPDWAVALISSALGRLVTEYHPPKVPIGAAPDALKAWVKQFLLEWAAKATNISFVNNVLVRVISHLDGSVLDYLWDMAQAKLVGHAGPTMKLSPPAMEPVVLHDLLLAHAA